MYNNNYSNPKVYLIDENHLQYVQVNFETGKLEKKILTRGIDIDSAAFDFLAESYHDEGLNDRYEEEHRDFLSEKIKGQVADGNDDMTEDPIENLSDRRSDILSSLFGEAEVDSEMVIVLREQVFPKLTEAQLNLIFAHYGEQRTLEDIRLEEQAITGKVITHQAMSNRLKKIHKRVETLIEEALPTEDWK